MFITFGNVFDECAYLKTYIMMVLYLLMFGIWLFGNVFNEHTGIWFLKLITFGNLFHECIHWELYIMMVVYLWYDIGIEDDIPVVGIWYLVFDNVFNDVQHCELFIMMVIYILFDFGIDDDIPVVGIWYLMFWKCI